MLAAIRLASSQRWPGSPRRWRNIASGDAARPVSNWVFARALAPSFGGAGELLPSDGGGEGGPPHRQAGTALTAHEGGAQHGRLQASVARFDVAELSLFCVRLRPRWLPGGAGKHGAKKPNGR
jgi:hypothetical protein